MPNGTIYMDLATRTSIWRTMITLKMRDEPTSLSAKNVRFDGDNLVRVSTAARGGVETWEG